MTPNPAIPIMLNLQHRHISIIGGGSVAHRRAKKLIAVGAQVTLIAPHINTPFPPNAKIIQKKYAPDDIKNAFLVIAATDNPALNQQVLADAKAQGILVSAADDPSQSDLQFLAHHTQGPITLAVHTQAISPSIATQIRDQLAENLPDYWQQALQILKPIRKKLQEKIQDPLTRNALLKSLASPENLAKLQTQGLQAYTLHCQKIYDQAIANQTPKTFSHTPPDPSPPR